MGRNELLGGWAFRLEIDDDHLGDSNCLLLFRPLRIKKFPTKNENANLHLGSPGDFLDHLGCNLLFDTISNNRSRDINPQPADNISIRILVAAFLSLGDEEGRVQREDPYYRYR